ncbi:F-box protein At2g21930-like [Arabidopsis lyrata subsp. lyrata]|uniref:F-box protein At2g21930-like n=1 Tax=Arabidopsis lyrata subsp. lyrata TaxID=81972 RepID=UPI000A29B5B8|nr:F-box protein At2g21930-like [Arabidopsis lyrata subsp. lyrata]|eukprot:XP_020885262.1 F-box protein At2g21930-like [Arabidopsis lyrata subsp. lyrata]
MERHGAKKKISDDHIPLDLMPEILKGLPVKTLARFLSLSKEYTSIIRNRDFMKSYLIKSSNRPQSLIITFNDTKLRSWRHFFFSVSQPQNRGESSSSVAVATYHMNCDSLPYTTYSASVHGLICHGPPPHLMVYNPCIRRSITLPKIDSDRLDMHHFLGYDPISGDYKVLCMVKRLPVTGDSIAQEIWVLTMGKENSWRMIEDCPPHFLDSRYSPEICINGVLYYGAFLDLVKIHAVMISFDVRSEKFAIIKLPDFPECVSPLNRKLTSYERKFAVSFYGNSDCRIDLWVLEDAVKHEWSKKSYVLPPLDGETYHHFYPFCATDGGEFVLAHLFIDRRTPFYVLYYNPKKNTVRRVYLEGIFTELKDQLWDKDSYAFTLSIFPGQIDNLMFL